MEYWCAKKEEKVGLGGHGPFMKKFKGNMKTWFFFSKSMKNYF